MNEWDKFAKDRSRQIRTGLDISFNNVLLPNIKNEIQKYDTTNVLDVGCGTGEITKEILKISKHIDAIDPSRVSIELAKEICLENIAFYDTCIEKFNTDSVYTLIYSNMVLMNIENLDNVIPKINHLLCKNGIFVFTIIHPCFWSIYKKYSSENNFDYFIETKITLPFDITNEKSKINTSHYHRPLEVYIKKLVNNNLQIINIKELKGENFIFPRFLMITCKKTPQ